MLLINSTHRRCNSATTGIAVTQYLYSDAVYSSTSRVHLYSPRALMPKLLCNRSLARLKAGRSHQALQDAEQAVTLAPSWDEAYLCVAAAHRALRQPLRAAEALGMGCQACRPIASQPLDETHPLCKQLRMCVASMTSHELAQGLMRLWRDESQQGVSPPMVHLPLGTCACIHFGFLSSYLKAFSSPQPHLCLLHSPLATLTPPTHHHTATRGPRLPPASHQPHH